MITIIFAAFDYNYLNNISYTNNTFQHGIDRIFDPELVPQPLVSPESSSRFCQVQFGQEAAEDFQRRFALHDDQESRFKSVSSFVIILKLRVVREMGEMGEYLKYYKFFVCLKTTQIWFSILKVR